MSKAFAKLWRQTQNIPIDDRLSDSDFCLLLLLFNSLNAVSAALLR